MVQIHFGTHKVKKMNVLWLDDERNPNDATWQNFMVTRIHGVPSSVIWVKSYDDFCACIKKSIPDVIFFDHDLGLPNQLKYRAQGKSKKESRRLAKQEEKTGYDCARWLIEYCIKNKKQLPLWAIQSHNPVGRKNIDDTLSNFKNKYETL